jgi:4-hydroxybenzoate polyprenyltransferase
MSLKTYLVLGRVSNLPTVWSNVVAGVVVSGAAPPARVVAVLALTMSFFYTGGMFLNDAFDRRIDARIHPERPIPSGAIGAGQVFAIGFGMLGAGLALLPAIALFIGRPALPALASGAALFALIVLYNRWHKENPLGPVFMGGCRMLVYAGAAAAVTGAIPAAVWRAGFVLLSYLIGLTYVAKQETLRAFRNFWPLVFLLAPLGYPFLTAPAAWLPLAVLASFFLGWIAGAVLLLRRPGPDRIPRAVVRLIAGISLFDALLAGSLGRVGATAFCLSCFGSTLFLQRHVRGT